MTIKYWYLAVMALAVTSIGFGGMSEAFALAELQVTTNAETIVITDCIALPCLGLDAQPAPGFLVAVLTSTNFPDTCAEINVDTGLSKPLLPGATMPHMDIGWVTVSFVGPCDIELLWTDTDFTSMNDVQCRGDVGGTTGGTFDGYSAFNDPANVMFSLANEILNTGPVAGTPFAASDTGAAIDADAAYSLTMKVEFSHGSGVVSSSGNAELTCDQIVGGTLLPISSQSLFLAGIQSMTVWMIPTVVGLVGAGVYLVKYKANKD